MTSTPDELAAATRDLALAALHEVTPAATVGPAAGHAVEEGGAVSLRFENRLPGYPGWYWTVTVAQIEGDEPTVLEVELMPGESALLAPDWVPWAERLAEYRAHQAELAAQADGDEEGDLDDVDDLDAADFDEDGSPHLHGGDLDGVDIDELDEGDESDDSDADDGGDESDDSDADADDSDSDDSDSSDSDDSDSPEPAARN